MGCCTGVCCAAFPWNRTPEQLAAEPWRSGGHTQAESRYIADMLVPLTPEEAKDRHELFGIKYDPEVYEREANKGSGWYTCRHWDEDTKLCTKYDERPMMCREFPYSRPCEHGCGYELAGEARAVYDRRQIEDGYGPLQILLGVN